MRLNSASLFAIPTLIWGSTFFVIKFQLGVVSPGWSVCYRFILAGLILLLYSKIRSLNLSFNIKEHLWMLMQGAFLFCLNYLLVYIAEEVLISALVAIAFAGIIFLNIFFGKILLNKPINGKVFIGAIIGLIGTIILFGRELGTIKLSELPLFHLILCFTSVVIASLGNITSARNQSHGLPVIQTNAFGMLYGGILVGIITLASGNAPTFDFQFPYVASLIYLSVLGSIIAFSTYLTLVGRIGADRAAYVLVILPLISVILSILFEGYSIAWTVFIGLALIISGNVMVIRR